jgi:hypothetical protein
VGPTLLKDQTMKTLFQALLAGAALVATAGPAAAMTFHAGEWTNVVPGGQTNVSCLQHDQDFNAALLTKMAQMPGANCTINNLKMSPLAASYTMVCTIGGGRMTIDSVLNVTGIDAYFTRAKSHFVGGSIKMPDMDMSQTAHRTGGCKPGDRVSPW